MSLKSSLADFMRSTPLTLKTVLLTVLVGILIMAVVDNFMTYYLQKDLQNKLSEELAHEAVEELVNFNHYVNSHKLAAKVLVGQMGFDDHARKAAFNKNDAISIHTKHPSWLPDTKELKLFPEVKYALFFDKIGRLKEVFQNTPAAVPDRLLRQAAYLLKQSNSKTMLANISGNPFLLASQYLTDSKGRYRAALMLASPIDEDFLFKAMGPLSHEHVIALLADDAPLVRVSSQPSFLPAGEVLNLDKYRFKALDIQSFDITAPNTHSRLAAIISTQEFTAEAHEILSRSRRHRTAMAVAIILACSGVIFWISKYVKRLSDDLVTFGNHALGIRDVKPNGGDELHRLKKQFHRLTEEVVHSHNIIRQEATEQNRIIVDNASEAIITFDQNDRITSWNPAAQFTFGWSPKEVLGKSLSKILVGQEKKGWHVLLANGLTGSGKQLEINVLHREGHEFPVEFLVSNFEMEGQNNFIAFARDISKRKKNEQEIREAYLNQTIINEILRISLTPISLGDQLQHALGHILTMNRLNLLAQGVIFMADEDAEELYIVAHQGLTEAKIQRCNRVQFGKCFCGRAAENSRIEFADCIDERHDITFEEMQPHGHYCVPILSGEKVLGVLGLYVPHGHQRKKEEEDILIAIANILAGIIERKRIEEQLVSLVDQQKSTIKELDDEKKFSGSIVRSLSSGLMVLDLEYKIIAANPIGSKIFRTLSNDLYNKNLEDIVGLEASELMTRINAENPVNSNEITLNIPKGGEMILSYTSTYREDAQGNRVGIIISFSDITRIKLIQDEMEKMNRLSTVAEIASAVAHEVRNPLAGIKTMSQSIEENLDDNDEKKEYIRRIIKQVDRLNELLTEFFTYARPGKPKKVKTSLVEIINETKPLISSRLSKNRISIFENYAPELPHIMADPNQIQQVFLNLMLNSMDAIRHDGMIEIVAERLDELKLAEYCMSYPGLDDAGNYVAVTFRDNGPGMPEEVALKAFEPFYTTKHSGSGLGLAIVYRILNENSASIYLDCTSSEEGTCFIMFFEA